MWWLGPPGGASRQWRRPLPCQGALQQGQAHCSQRPQAPGSGGWGCGRIGHDQHPGAGKWGAGKHSAVGGQNGHPSSSPVGGGSQSQQPTWPTCGQGPGGGCAWAVDNQWARQASFGVGASTAHASSTPTATNTGRAGLVPAYPAPGAAGPAKGAGLSSRPKGAPVVWLGGMGGGPAKPPANGYWGGAGMPPARHLAPNRGVAGRRCPLGTRPPTPPTRQLATWAWPRWGSSSLPSWRLNAHMPGLGLVGCPSHTPATSRLWWIPPLTPNGHRSLRRRKLLGASGGSRATRG